MKKIVFSLLAILFLPFQILSQSAAERFNLGIKALSNKDYVEANQYFDSFFRDYNEIDELYATAKYYSGESLLNLGETHAAKERFEFLVNNYKWSTFRDIALYKLGLIYFDLGEYEKSRIRLDILIKEYPESQYFGPALYWIGESYVEEKDIDYAIKYLENAVSKRKDNKYIDYSIYSLANVYERKGDFKQAVDYYDQLLSYYKDSKFAPIAQFRIAYCYFKLKEYNSAVIELNNPIIKTLPSNLHSEAIFLLANCHYRLNEFQKTEDICLNFILNNPSSDLIRDVKYSLAWSYFQQEKYYDAYEVFNSLSLIDDIIGVNSFYWKAEAIWYAGNTNEALTIFKEFIQKYPESDLISKAKYQVGGIYYDSDKIKDSEKYLLESVDSDNPIVKSKTYLLLGEMNLDEKKFSLAKENFKIALSTADTLSDIYSNALLGLGVSSFQLQQFNEAIKNLIDLETKDVNFSPNKVNFYLAESYFAKGSFKEALKRYNKIDKNDKELGGLSQYGKAYVYFNLKDYEDAVSAFSDFIKKNPHDKRYLDAQLRLADSYYGNKNYASAGKIYKEIFLYDKEKGRDPYVYYQYAQALYKGGNSSEAISEFRKLQSMFPESEYADKSLYVIGWVFFQQNSYNDAINSYRTLLSTYPNSSLNPIVYYSIGDAFFNLNKYDSAIVNYQKVINQYPRSNYVFDAVNGIQYCYVAQNKDEKAISLIEDFVRKNPNLSFSDQIYFKKGEIYYGQGSYEKAKLSYQEFTSRYPKSELTPDAYYWIGKSAQNLKQFDEAILNFNKVFNSYPGSNLAAASVIEMGNIYNQQKKYDLALDIYSTGTEKLSNSPQIAEILFMKATTFVNMGNVNSAYEVFAEIVQYHGETVFADQSKFEIGLIEYSAKRYDNAILYFRSISESRTDELGAEAQYYLGMSLFDQGKTNDAISAFVRVRTIFSYYDEWLSRSNIMLGDCYKKLNDFEKAKQFYRDVIAAHRSDEIGKTAQKKLREID
jgi:TolA-binding protein